MNEAAESRPICPREWIANHLFVAAPCYLDGAATAFWLLSR